MENINVVDAALHFILSLSKYTEVKDGHFIILIMAKMLDHFIQARSF